MVFLAQGFSSLTSCVFYPNFLPFKHENQRVIRKYELALTLPPGKDRDATLRQIYQCWLRTDPAASEAAEAFAKKHGIR